jgi:hypothetical protein
VLLVIGPALPWALSTQHFAVALLVTPILLAAGYAAWALIWRFGLPPQHVSV